MQDVKSARASMLKAQEHIELIQQNALKGRFAKVATHATLALFHLSCINLEEIAWNNTSTKEKDNVDSSVPSAGTSKS